MEAGGRPWPRWTKGLLVLSLTANLAVVGLMIGHYLQDERPRRGEFLDILVPQERRAEADALLGDRRARISDLRAELQGLRREMTALIASETFALEEFDLLLARAQEASAERRRLMQEQFRDLVMMLTPEERARGAARLNARYDAVRERRMYR
ncbi:MAG: periplasmic heavy metal sensor [Pseudomonadota bacterium]